MSSLASVRINRKAADRVLSGHPWIFASDVVDRGAAQPGDVVRVADARGQALGTAHYSSSSQITLRLLSRRTESIDRAFLESALRRAIDYRERVVSDTNAFRVVHAEGDLLPGLIVDRYADYAAVQFLTQGMDRLAGEIVEILCQLLSLKGVVARNDVAVRAKEELSQDVRFLSGDVPPAVNVQINELSLEVDLLGGQKTGVFLDQRENYLAVSRWAKGRALDCFTGSGGFALHLASVCESVEGVDSSAAAIASARRNAVTNRLTNVEFREANVLDYLPNLVAARRHFDLVVVDPPAFTKARSTVDAAARGYKEINLRALRLLSAGGVLVSCSCSHHMSEARLLEIVAQAALDSGKQLRVLERRTQAADHPILLTVPETQYLKCLFFQVI